jgi:hypothetical protein
MPASLTRSFPDLECVTCCSGCGDEKEVYASQLSSRRGMDLPLRASKSAQQSESQLVQFGSSTSTAGIGAVFGVAGRARIGTFLFFRRVLSGRPVPARYARTGQEG